MLLVGVPKEIKDNEYRVGIVLSTVPDSDCVAASTMVFASPDWPSDDVDRNRHKIK
jgi:hypothetical protein